MEPFYIRQQGEPKTPDERMAWFKMCAAEAKAEGAQLCRFTAHPSDSNLLLVECWKEFRVPDQGEPRWAMTAEKS